MEHESIQAKITRHWYERPVAWAFMFLFMLITLISLVTFNSLKKIEKEYVQKTRVHVEKLRLLDEMVHYSRQRSVLLRDIVIAEDPFRQDEIIQQHGKLATRYLLARNSLSSRVNAGREKELIDSIIELNSRGYGLQQDILAHAVNGERDKALGLVAGSLGPNREKIYPAMLEMKEILVSASIQAAADARVSMKKTKNVVIWLYAASLVLGIFIAWIAYRLDKRHMQQLNWQATHDELTGLLNRYEFESLLSKAIRFTGDRKKSIALVYLDIDQFNLINNTSGHDAGDELLRQVATTLLDISGDHAEVGRIGGDQFAVLLYNVDVEYATNIADKIARCIDEYQFMWSDRAYHITASVGVVASNDSELNDGKLLPAAYLACDDAKEGGGNRVEVYQGGKLDTQQKRSQLDWAARLKTALEDNKLVLFSQGIKPLHGEVTHSEILLRMKSESGGLVAAGQFIPAAERYKLISDIDLYVVDKVLQHMATESDGNSYSINLSGISLGNKILANRIIDMIHDYGINAEKICFEVTETAAITNKTTAIRFMHILHGIGCHFFLDDFGSGLSSFGYLRSLPIDMVKIDGHFVKNMHTDSANRSVISAINSIAHGFGMKTVAEYVESQRQMDDLAEIGVDYFQGFHIERPSQLKVA